MTLSQWKTIGAAILACVVAMGSLQAFAQFGGVGGADQAAEAKPVADDDRQTALTRAVSKLQAELDESNRRNADLQKRLHTIEAELKTLKANPTPIAIREAQSKLKQRGIDLPANPNFRGMGGGLGGLRGDFGASDPGQVQHYTQSNTVLVVSPVGGKIKVHHARTNKTQSFQLSNAEDTPLKVIPYSGPSVSTIALRGSQITGIIAAPAFDKPWVLQKLREPYDGAITPIVGPDIAAFTIGRYLYGFSPKLAQWDVVEMPKKIEKYATVGLGIASLENDGHVYTFESATGKWTDVDLRAILDAPDDKDPENAKPNQP